MSSALSGYVFCAKKNLDYGQKLVADLTEEQMTLQPAPSGERLHADIVTGLGRQTI